MMHSTASTEEKTVLKVAKGKKAEEAGEVDGISLLGVKKCMAHALHVLKEQAVFFIAKE